MEEEAYSDDEEVEEPSPREPTEPTGGRRSRRFVATINNPERELQDEGDEMLVPTGAPCFFALARGDKRIAALVVSVEYAPTTGTEHLQVYFETRSPASYQAIKLWPCFLGTKPFLETANGTAFENKSYVLHLGDHAAKGEVEEWEMWGVFSKSRVGQGKRSDWDEARRLAELQATTAEFMDAVPHLAMPHIGKIDQWRRVYQPVLQRTWKTVPKIFLGPPRVGKSTLMRAQAKALAEAEHWRIYIKSDSEDWWPDYSGEEIILIDEAHGGFWQWQQLLRFFEEGSYTLRQKYVAHRVELLARVVFMTTNTHPAVWYKGKAWDETNAFRARIEEFGELWVFRKRTPLEVLAKVYPEPSRDLILAEPPEMGANGRAFAYEPVE